MSVGARLWKPKDVLKAPRLLVETLVTLKALTIATGIRLVEQTIGGHHHDQL